MGIIVAMGVFTGVLFTMLYAVGGDSFMPWVPEEDVYVLTNNDSTSRRTWWLYVYIALYFRDRKERRYYVLRWAFCVSKLI